MSNEMSEPSKKFQLRFPSRFPVEPSRSQASMYFITGVVLPASCLVHAANGLDASPLGLWQSGEIAVFTSLLLDVPSILAFLPMMLYSMISVTSWAFRPSLRCYSSIRCGIYLGTLLSLQVLIMIMITTGWITLLAAVIVGPSLAVLVYGLTLLAKHYRRFSIRHLLILTTIVAVLLAILRLTTEYLMVLLTVDITTVAAAPTLAFITYGRSSVALLNSQTQSNPVAIPMIGWFSSIAGWIASWKLALLIMINEYSKLPTVNPNCYVSSAAAHGHSIVVRSEIIFDSDNSPLRVNQQMRRLKFLELALMSSCPSMYRHIRRIYDCVGPPMAQVIKHDPYSSDVAYLLLIPLEFVAEVLRWNLGITSAQIERLYRAGKTPL